MAVMEGWIEQNAIQSQNGTETANLDLQYKLDEYRERLEQEQASKIEVQYEVAKLTRSGKVPAPTPNHLCCADSRAVS